MSESEMYEQEEVAPQKRGVPTWLWFCGGGCLIAVVLAIGAGVWMFGMAKDMVDPDKQWPRVAEVLPFDERPTELSLQMGWGLGLDMFLFEHQDGYQVILMGLPEQQDASQLLDPNYEGGVGPIGRREGGQGGTVEVQGRELRLVRFHQLEQEGSGPGETVQSGASVMVDLTQPDATQPLLLQVIRLGQGGEITDEEIRTILEPFHVGPDR